MKYAFRLLLLLLPTLCAVPVRADEPVPALPALERLRERFGAEALFYVFEMTGTGGDPQPSSWRITAHDPARNSVLHEYWIGERRITDEGLNDDFYPDRLPKGFFKVSRVKLDSTQAFAIAEQVARDSGNGFDAVNYKLHSREYTSEPVWTLTLLDKEEEIVGSVHLSADSGEVLRTVWMHRKRNGRLSVEDSALSEEPKNFASRNAGKKGEPGVAGTTSEPPPPAPADPSAVAPSVPVGEPRTEKNAEDQEIPEIKRLNAAQEKAQEAPPKKP